LIRFFYCDSICSHAFLAFPDDASAAAAVKQGATFKNTQLKVGFQNKRAEPQKRSSDAIDNSGDYLFPKLNAESDVYRFRTEAKGF
jgi:hypothetical protein